METQEFVKTRSLLDYAKVFFRRRWLLVPPIFIALVLSIVAGFALPPTYESATVILVEEEKAINPLMQGLAVSTNVAQRMQTIKELLLSWKSLVSLSQKLNLDKNVKTQLGFEGLILGLRRNIHVSMRGPNLIKISYFGKDPVETQLVAKTLTDILMEENMRAQTKETEVAIQFIEEQLQVYKRKIKDSEIASLEEQLKALLVDSTEEHPMVKDLRQKIAAARKELDSGEYKVAGEQKPVFSPIYEKLKTELDKMVEKESAAVSQLAYAASPNESSDANESIYKLMVMDKMDAVLARDLRVNENIYNMLLQKLETAKITQRLETSKQGTRYTIIDPPRLPLKASKPNKIMLVFLGMFLGSFSGAGLVLGKEFMDHSFLDIEDAKANLELPVLGAISRITTQEEIDKENLRKRQIITIGLITGAVVIVIAFFVYLFR
ncbi:MAG: GNVR domain-containing protein [Candidatus Omnitrophota bacterium]